MPAPASPSSPSPCRPFQGWCTRGAWLPPEDADLYRPGLAFKHLGTPRAQAGPPHEAPAFFRILAHRAQAWGEEIRFPEDAVFWVRDVHAAPGGRPCIGLEQRHPAFDLAPAFEGPFRAWAATLPRRLPKPPPALLAEARAPFAQWAPEAARGDPPIQGLLWDFDEAVAFAEAWSGEPRAAIAPVLEARCRYLERAGLTGSLPESPDLIDAQEIHYLVRRTGLPRSQVQRIVQAETAYQDHLGILEWDGPEARREALGLPPPEDQGPWAALFPGDPTALPRHLGEVLRGARRIGTFPSPLPRGGRMELSRLPAGPGCATLALTTREGGLHRLVAAYPLLDQAPLHAFGLEELRMGRAGLEADALLVTDEGTRFRARIPAPPRFGPALRGGGRIQARLWMAAQDIALSPGPSPPEGDGDRSTLCGRLERCESLSAWNQPMSRLRLEGPVTLDILAPSRPWLKPGPWIRVTGPILAEPVP